MQGLGREEAIKRILWSGQEYYQAQIPVPERMDDSLAADQIESWARGLLLEEWFEAGVLLLGRYFSHESIQKSPSLVLLMAYLLRGSGRPEQVFKWITSNFVNSLSEEEKGRAFCILGQSLLMVHKTSQAESAFKNSFNQYRAKQNLEGQAEALMELGDLTGRTADQSRALKFFEQALSFAEKSEGSTHLLGLINLKLADFYARATDFDNAEQRYQASMEHFLEAGLNLRLAEVYLNYAQMVWERGDLESSDSYVRESLNLSSFKKNREFQGKALLLMAEIEENRGNPGATLERLNESLFYLEGHYDPLLYTEALVRRAYFYESNRQVPLAQADAQRVLEMAQRGRDAGLKGRGHLVMGKVLRRETDQLADAMKQFEMAREELEKVQDQAWIWECEFEKGEIERSLSNNEKARTHYEQALKVIDQYLGHLPTGARERFLKDGRRDRVEMALKWLE